MNERDGENTQDFSFGSTSTNLNFAVSFQRFNELLDLGCIHPKRKFAFQVASKVASFIVNSMTLCIFPAPFAQNGGKTCEMFIFVRFSLNKIKC